MSNFSEPHLPQPPGSYDDMSKTERASVDIVERLRRYHPDGQLAGQPYRDVQEAANEIDRLRAENERLEKELSLWKPLSPEEAEKAIDEAESVPIDPEEIRAIVERVTDPAYRPTEPQRVLMAARIRQLDAENERLHADYRIQNNAIVLLTDQLKVAVEALEWYEIENLYGGKAYQALARIREIGKST